MFGLLPDNVCTESTVGPRTVSFLTDRSRQIENNCDSEHMMFTRKFDQGLAVLSFDIRRIDNG